MLKSKLQETAKNNIKLTNEVDVLKKKLEATGGETTGLVDDHFYRTKMMQMQKNHDAVVKNLSRKIADLEMQEVRLSRVSSNVDDILSERDKNLKLEDFKDMDSNISFSVGDLQGSTLFFCNDWNRKIGKKFVVDEF